MSKGMVDRLRELREAKMARNAERAKVEAGIRKAAAEGAALLALPKTIKRKLKKAIDQTAERMKNKPAKKAKGKRK